MQHGGMDRKEAVRPQPRSGVWSQALPPLTKLVKAV